MSTDEPRDRSHLRAVPDPDDAPAVEVPEFSEFDDPTDDNLEADELHADGMPKTDAQRSGHAKGKTSKRSITSRERKRRALQLRTQGWTFQRIADEVGYKSARSAGRAVKSEMDKLPREAAEELSLVQRGRLNALLAMVWDDLEVTNDEGETRVDLSAVEMARKLIADLGKAEGTDAAKQVEINATGTVAVQHETAILMLDGTTEDYVRKLQQATGFTPLSLEAADEGDGGPIFEAELVEEDD